MNFDDLKDQLREAFQNFMAKVQESTAWIQLEEKFQNLSPNAQKGVLAGAGSFVALILLAIPWSYYSSSQEFLAEYDEKKQLIRELFRVSRASSILQNAPPAVSVPQLQSDIQNRLSAAQLQPDQIRGVTEFDNAGPQASPSIPKNVIQKGVQVSLAKLNLRQLVDLGFQMQSVHPNAKMVSLEVSASHEDPHYFDVVYRIIGFSLPAEPQKGPPPGGARGGAKPPPPKGA